MENFPLPNAREAARVLEDSSFVHVIAHHDADGISTGAIVCKAVHASGGRYHFKMFGDPGDSEIGEELNGDETVVFCDIGASFLDEIDASAIVIDHHPFFEEDREKFNGTLVTPRDVGEESSSSCGAYSVALELGVEEEVLALVGAVGDGVNLREGIAGEILDRGIEKGSIETEKGARVTGDNPVEALAYSTDPYTEYTGDIEGSRSFVEELGLDPEKSFEELSDEEFRQFSTALVLLGLKKPDSSPEAVESVVGERYRLSGNVGGIADLHSLSNYVEACAKEDKGGLGLALCIGRDGETVEEGRQVYRSFQSRLIEQVEKAEDCLRDRQDDGIVRENEKTYENIEVAFIDDGFDTGSVADVLGDWVVDVDNVLVMNQEGDASIRCGPDVDAGEVMRKCATRVGGEGGGHPGRGGANIPRDKAKDFVENVKETVERLAS